MISHSSKATGGGEDDFLKLMNFFNGKYRILSVMPEGERCSVYKKLSVKSLVVPDYMFPFEKFSLKKYIFYFYNSISKLRLLSGFIRENKTDIDVCFVNSSACLAEIFVLNMLRVPYVLSVKEIINPVFARKALYGYFNRTAQKIILISQYLKSLFIECTGSDKTEIIYSSVDEDMFLSHSEKYTPNTTADSGTFRIISIGGIQPLKNQMHLIKAVSRYEGDRTLEIVLAGKVIDEDYFGKLQAAARRINNSKVKIIFAGELEKPETIKALCGADCAVITSLSEGMSIVAAEALLLGKPVISTPVGVIPEVITDGYNGFIVDPDAPEGLLGCIERLSSDSILYGNLAGNCRKSYFDFFSNEKYLKGHRMIIDAVLENIKRKN